MNTSILKDQGSAKYIAAWLLIVTAAVTSAAAIVICIVDKLRSKQTGRIRISEATLMTVSAFGGAAAMYLTMLIIRHKTKHPRFMVCLPLMILFHAVIAYLIFF